MKGWACAISCHRIILRRKLYVWRCKLYVCFPSEKKRKTYHVQRKTYYAPKSFLSPTCIVSLPL